MIEKLKNIENKIVLIIDDEVDFGILLKNYLLRKGCAVFISHNLNDAFINIKRNLFDVILFDAGICNDPESAIKEILAIVPHVQFILISTPNMEP